MSNHKTGRQLPDPHKGDLYTSTVAHRRRVETPLVGVLRLLFSLVEVSRPSVENYPLHRQCIANQLLLREWPDGGNGKGIERRETMQHIQHLFLCHRVNRIFYLLNSL